METQGRLERSGGRVRRTVQLAQHSAGAAAYVLGAKPPASSVNHSPILSQRFQWLLPPLAAIMRLWALAFCAACLAAQVLFAQGKTHGFADHLEAKREAALLKKQVP